MFKKNYTTEMSGSKKTVEKRFKAISVNKKRGIITGVSVIAAAAIVCGAVWINGMVSDSTEIYGGNKSSAVTATINPQENLAMVNPYMTEKNPYNEGAVDVSGRTVGDIAEELGVSPEEFLESQSLPADMPADTYETAAYGFIPCKKIAEMYGLGSFEELDSLMHFPDFINEDSTWHEALGEVTLGNYVGTGETLDQFKDYYGLGNDVTADTKWKEVANIVNEQQRQERIGAENETAE